MRRCGRVDKRDIVATATALTARSIARCFATICICDQLAAIETSSFPVAARKIRTLMAMLANELRPLGLQIRSSDEFGLPSEAKEAAAFALLAFKRGIAYRRICPPLPGQKDRRFWERFPMRKRTGFRRARRECRRPGRLYLPWCLIVLALLVPLLSCSAKPDSDTLVMIIENSPTNLDPRVGLDAQSERIDELLFDDLCTRDEHLNVQPGLAERWEVPDPRTYVFHLHKGAKFHDGRPLTSRDVKWTFDSLLQGKFAAPKQPPIAWLIISTHPTITRWCFI